MTPFSILWKRIRGITSGRLLGRLSAGTGRAEELTASDVRGWLSVYTVAQTDTAISNGLASLVDSSPGTLDTLNELAAALGDDPNFATTVSSAIGEKYTLPGGGIPKSDLSAAVQTALGKADSALQSVHITAGDNIALSGEGTSASPYSIRSPRPVNLVVADGTPSKYWLSSFGSNSLLFVLLSDTLYLAPIVVHNTKTFTRASIATFDSTELVRLGLYRSDPTTGLPTTLVLDFGTVTPIAGAAATIETAAFSVSLPPGLYYFGMITAGSPTVRAAGNSTTSLPLLATRSLNGIVSNVTHLTRAKTFGALDATEVGQTYTAQINAVPLGFLR